MAKYVFVYCVNTYENRLWSKFHTARRISCPCPKKKIRISLFFLVGIKNHKFLLLTYILDFLIASFVYITKIYMPEYSLPGQLVVKTLKRNKSSFYYRTANLQMSFLMKRDNFIYRHQIHNGALRVTNFSFLPHIWANIFVSGLWFILIEW